MNCKRVIKILKARAIRDSFIYCRMKKYRKELKYLVLLEISKPNYLFSHYRHSTSVQK